MFKLGPLSMEGGGLTATTYVIEIYHGFPQGIHGAELIENFETQAFRFGAKLAAFEEVLSIASSTGEAAARQDRQFQNHDLLQPQHQRD